MSIGMDSVANCGVVRAPCGGLLRRDGGAADGDVRTALSDLVTNSQGLARDSEAAVNDIRSRFPLFFTARYVQLLDTVHFLEQIDTHTPREQTYNNSQLAARLLSHWGRLSKLLKNLEYVRTHNELATAHPDGSHLGEVRRHLDHLHQRIDSLSCHVKIALNVLETDSPTPEYEASVVLPHVRVVKEEIWRAYIVIREVDASVNFYHTVYSEMVNRYE